MPQLIITDPEIWSEINNGNWVVNKNAFTFLAFCSIGPDHALKQINRWVKITGCLVGMTLNKNARNSFFLISAKLTYD